MFKKLIVLTAILLSGSKEVSLPHELIIEIKGEEVQLAVIPINEEMATRYVYTALDPKFNISFNTLDRDYNFSKGRLESKIDSSIISIPDSEDYKDIKEQMEYLVGLGFFVKDKDYIHEGKLNLKGYYKDSIKVISNNKLIEETNKVKGTQYKLTSLGVEHLAKKNEEVLVYLGHLEADIIKLVKDYDKETYTATYKLYLEETPDWINKTETIDLFNGIYIELKDIERSNINYNAELIYTNNNFKLLKANK